MKIAVPTRENVVDDHYGHCELFTVFTLNKDGEIKQEDTIPSLQGCGCKSNIASVLKDAGVTVMLAGNMGSGAVNVLQNHGIDVYRGCSGNVRRVAEEFTRGALTDSGVNCDLHHDAGGSHACNH